MLRNGNSIVNNFKKDLRPQFRIPFDKAVVAYQPTHKMMSLPQKKPHKDFNLSWKTELSSFIYFSKINSYKGNSHKNLNSYRWLELQSNCKLTSQIQTLNKEIFSGIYRQRDIFNNTIKHWRN